LRANQGRASALADSVHRLYERQEQLRRACDDIEAYQEDLEADLATIEVRIYTRRQTGPYMPVLLVTLLTLLTCVCVICYVLRVVCPRRRSWRRSCWHCATRTPRRTTWTAKKCARVMPS